MQKITDESTIKEIIDMDMAIKQAHEKIKYILRDKETLRIYQMRGLAQKEAGIKKL